MESRRTDLLGFINGIPLILIEVKATGKRVMDGIQQVLNKSIKSREYIIEKSKRAE